MTHTPMEKMCIRDRFMLADYAGIRVPVVLLLNMMDVAERQGKKINTAGLQKALGIPVIPMVAADKKQYQPFFQLLENLDAKEMCIRDRSNTAFYHQG